MVASGLVLGLVTGGFPAYSKEISQLALAVGMAFSLSEITLKGISPRDELVDLMAGDPALAQRLAHVLAASSFATDLIVSRPDLLDALRPDLESSEVSGARRTVPDFLTTCIYVITF